MGDRRGQDGGPSQALHETAMRMAQKQQTGSEQIRARQRRRSVLRAAQEAVRPWALGAPPLSPRGSADGDRAWPRCHWPGRRSMQTRCTRSNARSGCPPALLDAGLWQRRWWGLQHWSHGRHRCSRLLVSLVCRGPAVGEVHPQRHVRRAHRGALSG